MTITGLIEYIIAVVGNMVKGIINVNYKAIIEVLMEVYFKVITRRNTMFIRS
jgi:hypothetical protein